MTHERHDLRLYFVQALQEINELMSTAYAQAGQISDDHPLAQEGLRNGSEIVLDYLDHNEAGIAFEHMLYMVNEPPLVVSEGCADALIHIATTLEIPFTPG